MPFTTETFVVRRSTPHQTIIPTETLRDTRLSFRARGALAFLLSFEDDTLISTSDLPKWGPEGRDSLRTALRELRERKYVRQTREAYLAENGKQLWATATIISDVPMLDEVDVPKPRIPTPEPENRSSEIDSNSGTDTPSDTPVIPTRSDAGISGCMLLTTTASSGSSRSLHTSYEDSSTGVTARRGWVPKRSKTAEEDEGPSDPLSLLDEPQPEPKSPVDMVARREEIAHRRRTRPVGPSENLARYFASLGAQRAAEGAPVAPGMVNKAALATQFAAWAREGHTPEQIRTMIETYWQPWFDRSEVHPAWVDFLAKRAHVMSEGLRLAKQAEHEANRYNEDYWRGTPRTGYDSL